MEYGEGMDASEEYAEITEYYKAHPDEYAEYAEEIDAYLKDLEDCAAVIDGWADKYIKYYRAEKDSEGVYVKTGSALEAAPTEAGDYVAELVADPELFGSDTKIFVGYTIGKADPLYEVPEGLSAEFGDKLSGVKFSKAADGEWSWNDEETKVSKLDVYKGMATFTPEDQKNYNTLTYVRVPVKVTTTTETNIADRALVDAAYDAVDAFRKKQSRANINAAQAALEKIRTNNQKMMYGASKLADDLSAVETARKKLVKTVTINTKTVTAKKVKTAITKAGGDSKYVTTIILGKKVAKIGKSAFKSCKKVKTLTVKTKKLKKATVKQSLKGSKIRTVKVKVGKKATNKKYVKKYKKIFTRKIVGKKVKVTL